MGSYQHLGRCWHSLKMGDRIGRIVDLSSRKRQFIIAFFVVGHRRVQETLIHVIFYNLWSKFGFKWLEISIDFTFHFNMDTTLNNDTACWLMKGIVDERYWTCFKWDYQSIFGGRWCDFYVVYELICCCCKTYYIGKIKSNLKAWVW